MPKAIKVSDSLADAAALFAKVEHRSLAGQIEYWAKLGKIAEENPDLPISFIKDIQAFWFMASHICIFTEFFNELIIYNLRRDDPHQSHAVDFTRIVNVL